MKTKHRILVLAIALLATAAQGQYFAPYHTADGLWHISDSTAISDMGGLCVLMKNGWDSTVYKGNPALTDTAHNRFNGAATYSIFGMPGMDGYRGLVYSDSITPNSWGYITIAGKSFVGLRCVLYISQGMYMIASGTGEINMRRCTLSSNGYAPASVGRLYDTHTYGVNARGDTLGICIVNPISMPDAP